MNLTNPIPRILAVVFGATTGVSGILFTPKEARVVFELDIPWDGDEENGLYWPMGWLNYLVRLINSYVVRGDIVTMAMWGADLVANRGQTDQVYPAMHYRSSRKYHLQTALGDMDPCQAYIQTNGAHVAPHQPMAMLNAMAERQPWAMTDIGMIRPVGDYLTELVSGFRLYDSIMLQSLGLGTEAARKFYASLFPRLASRLLPPEHTPQNDALFAGIKIASTDKILRQHGIVYMPCTHDSVFARLVGFATGRNWVIWSGTWVGIAVKLDAGITPSEQTFAAHIAIEGIDHCQAAITNTGNFGRIYKALLGRAGAGYEEAAKYALDSFSAGLPILKFDLMPEGDEEACDWIMQQQESLNPLDAAACLVFSVAQRVHDEITKVAEALGFPVPESVAIIGGWGQNMAFREAVRRYAIDVVVPPMSMHATHYGIAAEALRRWANWRRGPGLSYCEALERLPMLK